MNKNTFDEILKQNVINTSGMDLFGYEIGGKIYSSYYNVCAFEKYTNQMKNEYPEYYKRYSEGKGNELVPNKGKYSLNPPKMASVASSSRFCYLALRNCGRVDFEHACPIEGIRGGTPPQMDAYIPQENTFIEVKCHEIFDSHKVTLKQKYFDFIFGENNDFGLESLTKDDKELFEIPLSIFGIKTESAKFDIKQLVCHLLGVKSHKNQDEMATLVYLFFKPKTFSASQQAEIDNLFDELKTEIETIFNSLPIKNFVKKNNIQLKAIAQHSEVMAPITTENIIHLYP